MPRPIFANVARSTLAIATPKASISITVPFGEGARFPAPDGSNWFMVTVEDRRTNQIEIMRCLNREGDVFLVDRGQEDTEPQDFLPGATVSNRLTAGTLDEIFERIVALEGGP